MVHPIMAIGAMFLVLGLAAAGAHVVMLPKHACNQGTEQAQRSIPPTLPHGGVTPGHFHVPEIVNGNCTAPHQ